MMKVTILYGTESGNAEMIAEDIAEAIADHEVSVVDMPDFDVEDLNLSDIYLIICSTYGDGDLPSGAKPFYARLAEEKPDLTKLRYAMFGLGDRSYVATYSKGSEIIDSKLQELGARRYGEYGRHDASSLDSASDLAIHWAEKVLEEAEKQGGDRPTKDVCA